ncbi:MAG: glycoside hydrolase family 30 beta sandwich domain-containing protein [Christensenellales bacterium]|jgi:glucosylceramidase
MKFFTSTQDLCHQFTMMSETTLQKMLCEPNENTFIIDPTTRGQPILGFGGNLTDTDVYNLMRMSSGTRKAVLEKLFSPSEGAGWNFLRLPLGSTDWERNLDFYSYDDMPEGQKDWALEHFSVQKDEDRGFFDLLQQIITDYPHVLFVGSVWAVPGWMKSTDNILGGIFLPEYTDVYAKYLRMAVQAFEKRGIKLYAITIQNEPKSSDFPNSCRQSPATRFTWRLQKDVLIALRKEFNEHNISTHIWAYDHNYDMANIFVDPLLKDMDARKAIDGLAFHSYRGDPKVLSQYTRNYPDLPLHCIEKTVNDPSGMDEVLRQLRYGARSYLMWSFIQDNYGGPHQLLGGPFKYLKETKMGVIYSMIDNPDDWRISASYGLLGIFSKFIKRGMQLALSKYGHSKWLSQAAFVDENGDVVSIIVNQTNEAQQCNVRIGNKGQYLIVPPMSVNACVIAATEYSSEDKLDIYVPEKQIHETPVFDMEPVRMYPDEPPVAGKEVRFKVELKNAGNAATPENMTASVDFLLDGDFRIGRAYGTIKPLQPGESVILSANTPLPDLSGTGVKTTWTAVRGEHDFMALLNIGNCYPPEENEYNNRLCMEMTIP